MQAEHIYHAAHQEVVGVRAILEAQAACFHQSFLLSTEEMEELNVHAELHASGAAIELASPEMDVVFSLGTVFDREHGRNAWDLLAFHDGDSHGGDSIAQWVATMRVGPTQSERSRRLRGARLVATIGDYLERRQVVGARNVIATRRTENSIACLPELAAQRSYHSLIQ